MTTTVTITRYAFGRAMRLLIGRVTTFLYLVVASVRVADGSGTEEKKENEQRVCWCVDVCVDGKPSDVVVAAAAVAIVAFSFQQRFRRGFQPRFCQLLLFCSFRKSVIIILLVLPVRSL